MPAAPPAMISLRRLAPDLLLISAAGLSEGVVYQFGGGGGELMPTSVRSGTDSSAPRLPISEWCRMLRRLGTHVAPATDRTGLIGGVGNVGRTDEFVPRPVGIGRRAHTIRSTATVDVTAREG